MQVGVDIEDISRFEGKSLDNDKHFLERIYTKNELEYCFKSKSSAKHLAARFCAKEAIYKALNSLTNQVYEFKNIEILNKENGSPYVILHNIDIDVNISLSLSHDKTKAIAFVLVEYI